MRHINDIEVEFRRGTHQTHSGYIIKDKHNEKSYERRAEFNRGFIEMLTPYLHGNWARVKMEISVE